MFEVSLVLLLLAILMFAAGLAVLSVTRRMRGRHPVVALYIHHGLAVVAFAVFVLLAHYSLYRNPPLYHGRAFVYPEGDLRTAVFTLGQRVFQAFQIPLGLAVGLAAVRIPVARRRRLLVALGVAALALMVPERVVNIVRHLRAAPAPQDRWQTIWWSLGGLANAVTVVAVGAVVFAGRRRLVFEPLISISRYLGITLPFGAAALVLAVFPSIIVHDWRPDGLSVTSLVIAAMMTLFGLWPLLNGTRMIRIAATAPAPRVDSDEAESLFEMSGITTSERRVIRLVARGKTNARVAEELAVSQSTVKNHLYSAYRKLGVTNRMELIVRLHAAGRRVR